MTEQYSWRAGSAEAFCSAANGRTRVFRRQRLSRTSSVALLYALGGRHQIDVNAIEIAILDDRKSAP